MDIKTGDKVIVQDFLTLQEDVAEVIEVFKCLDSKEKEMISKKFYRIKNLSKGNTTQNVMKDDLIYEKLIIGLVVDIANKNDNTEQI